MKKQIIIILLCLLTFSLYSQDYPVYDYKLVKTFPVGQGNNELGYDDKNFINSGPSAIAFDNDGNLYISDIINRRMLKFDNNYQQVKEYKNGYCMSASQLFKTESGEFISITGLSISIDDSDGNMKAIIIFENSEYRNKLSSPVNLIYTDNIVFTYLKDGSLISIPEPTNNKKENLKKILNEEQTIKYLQEKYGTQDTKSRTVRTNNSTLTIDESGNIVVNGDIKTQNLTSYYQYKQSNKTDQQLTKSNNTDKPSYLNLFTDEYILKKFRHLIYLGKDNDNNTYWYGACVYVFNKNGEITEAFKFDYEKTRITPAIHPSGDVYFIDYDDKQVYLYRIKRVW